MMYNIRLGSAAEEHDRYDALHWRLKAMEKEAEIRKLEPTAKQESRYTWNYDGKDVNLMRNGTTIGRLIEDANSRHAEEIMRICRLLNEDEARQCQ